MADAGEKERQVKALREARYARAHGKPRLAKVEIEAVTKSLQVTPNATPRFSHEVTKDLLIEENRKLMAQVIHLEAEIKWLKQQIAKDGKRPMTGAERVRKCRERRRGRSSE